MTDRERFEVWASSDGLWPAAVARNGEGGYRLMHTAAAWDVWQASRKQALEDAAVKIETTWAGTSHEFVCKVFSGIVRSVANPEGEQG